MRLDTALRELDKLGHLDSLRRGWDASLARMPSTIPSFLGPDQFVASRRYAGLPTEADEALRWAAARIVESPALLHLSWHAYQTLLQSDRDFNDWPTLDSALGQRWGAFYMLVGLAAVPHIRSVHRTMGVPETITRDTCHVLVCLSWNYDRSFPGRLGIMLRELSWVRNHLQGRLFRIGRLEFMIGPFEGGLEAYRHRRSGQVIALAADGTRFRADGFMPYRGDAPTEGDWIASLERSHGQIRGCPIAPYGIALQRQVCLSLDDWGLELEPGQLALEFHIPEGGGMTLTKCLDSMERGLAFFGRFFPDTPVNAFHSFSWIFGPQLESYLPPTANLVRLLREVYLYPVKTTPRDGLYYLFGDDNIDLDGAPRDTSLRRATLDYLHGGGSWRCGGMFVLGDDLKRFGAHTYRSDWEVALGSIVTDACAGDAS